MLTALRRPVSWTRVLLLGGAALLAGCGGGGSDPVPGFLYAAIGPAGGDAAAGTVALRIAPGNFATETSVSIIPQNGPLPIETSKPDVCSYTFLGTIYCCGPIGQPLPAGGVLRMSYNPALIPAGFTEDDLILFEWDEVNGVLRPNLSPDVFRDAANNALIDPSYAALGHVAVGIRDCPILVLEQPDGPPASAPGDPGASEVVAAPVLFRRLANGSAAPQVIPTTGIVDAFVPSPTSERVLFRTLNGAVPRDLWSSPTDASTGPVGVGGVTDRLDPVESLFGWLRDASPSDAFFAPFLSNYFAGLGGPDISFLARRDGDAATPKQNLTSIGQCRYFDDLRQSAAGNLLLLRSYDYDNLASPWGLDVVEAATGTPRVLDGFPSLMRPEPLVGTYRRNNLRPAKAQLYPWQEGSNSAPLQVQLDALTVNAGGSPGAIDSEPHQSPHSQFRLTGASASITLAIEQTASFVNQFGIYDIYDPSRKALIFDGPSSPGASAVIAFLGDGSVNITTGSTTTNYPGVGSEFGFYITTPEHTLYSEDVLNPECAPQLLTYEGRGQTVSLDGGVTTETFGPTKWIVACEDRLRSEHDQDYNDLVVFIRGLEPIPQPEPFQPSPAHLMPRWMSLQDRVYGIEQDGQTIASFAPNGSDRQVLLTLGTPLERVLDVCLARDDETFAAVLRRVPLIMEDLRGASASTQGVAAPSDVLVMGTLSAGVLGTLDLGEQASVTDLLFLAAPGHVVAGLRGTGGPRVVHAVLDPAAPLVSLGAALGVASLDDLDVNRDNGRLLLRRNAPLGLFFSEPDGALPRLVPDVDPSLVKFARWVISSRTTPGMSGVGAHR